MRNHLKDNWGFYIFGISVAVLLWTIVAVSAEEDRRTTYCYERGAVPVRTDAGWRCAQLYALEPIR